METEKNEITRHEPKVRALVPATLEEAGKLAKYYYEANFLKVSFKSAGEIFFAINLGLELGLTPAQAVQNIAVINNRACVWGDMMLAIVYGSGSLEYLNEDLAGTIEDGTMAATCLVKRKGYPEIKRTFSIDDAKMAHLWVLSSKDIRHKRMPWSTYPKRMLQMRARTFALRDSFPDVLKGLTSVEEAKDIPTKSVYESSIKKKQATSIKKELPESDITVHYNKIGEPGTITAKYSREEIDKMSGQTSAEKIAMHRRKASVQTVQTLSVQKTIKPPSCSKIKAATNAEVN